jgi:putative tryptophan/tyrosine transport system substrate-binding protein
VNPNNASAAAEISDVEAAARAIGKQVVMLRASTGREIEMASAAIVRQRVEGLMIAADTFFEGRSNQIVELAAQQAMPAIYFSRHFVTEGGLMSYGSSITDGYRQVGLYAGRILKGDKPADLPVMQPTKFDLIINLKTAKALGLDVPPTLLARADEVIE